MNKDYKKMLEALLTYFKSGECDVSNYKLGMELEHFILNKDTLKSIPYQGKYGIEEILNELTLYGWQAVYEDGYLLGLRGRDANISLEPGGQFELSFQPVNSLKEFENIYNNILNQLLPILEKRNYILFTTGYHPVSKIEEIKLLPKERYQYMYEYFKNKGKYAHNMMKGTSSIQVNLDYSSEDDFRKKIRVAYFLSPLIYYFFDNGPFFEGIINSSSNIRSDIWDNCDRDRCGFIDNVFNDNFSYSDYANYILNTPTLISLIDKKLVFTGEKLNKEVYDINSFSENEIEHILSMVFPDVRIKKFIEIRMGDSLPYPLNLSYIAFWQGLLYNKVNLDRLYEKAKKYKKIDIINIKNDIRFNGRKGDAYGKPLDEFMFELLEMASGALEKNEFKYLSILKKFLIENDNPKMKTLNIYNREGNIKEAVEWCIVKGGLTDIDEITKSI